MKYILLFITIALLYSCNPCKYVAKHPECFPADTIKITNDVVRYEKEFITNDSIVFQAIPCDPIDSIIYKTRTIYKTNNKIVIDTIYQSKEISKINPINSVLEQENISLNNKVSNKNKIIIVLLIITLGLLLIIKFK